MYRVQQHLNGTIYVFDRPTGRLAMIIKGDNKENGIAKTEPLISKAESKMGQLLSMSNFGFSTLKDKFSPSVNLPKITYCSDDDKNQLKSAAAEFDRSTPFESELSSEQQSEEVTDKASFLRLFGLKRADSPPLAAFQSARGVKAADRDSPLPPLADPEEQRSITRSEISDVDLSSRLGQLVLGQARNGNLWARDSAQNVGRYEKYCLVSTRRFGSWEIAPRDCNGNCIYHVTYQPIPTNNHKYLFNRKQRVERLKIIDTGLNKRARSLKRLCRAMSVRLVRLSKGEISKWTARRTFSTTRSHLYKLLKRPPGLPQLGACIDGTVVIEINDSSDDDAVTVSPKPLQKTGSGIAPPPSSPYMVPRRLTDSSWSPYESVTLSSGGRLLSFSNLFPKSPSCDSNGKTPAATAFHCFKSYPRNGCDDRQVQVTNLSIHSRSIRDRSACGPNRGKRRTPPATHPLTNGSAPKSARSTRVANGHAEDSDSSDSDIVFLGCVSSEGHSNGANAASSCSVPAEAAAAAAAQLPPRFVVTDFCQTDLGRSVPLAKDQSPRPSLLSPCKVVPQILVIPISQPNRSEDDWSGNRVTKITAMRVNGETRPCPLQSRRVSGAGATAAESVPIANGGSRVQCSPLTGGAVILAVGANDCAVVSDTSLEKLVTQQVYQAISPEIASFNMKSFHEENGFRLLCTFMCHMCSSEEMLTANAMKKISLHMGNFHGGLVKATLVSNVESVGSREIAISVQAFHSGL